MNPRSFLRWDEGLTGPTLDIARIETSPLRVLAGPGTGKTFSMMRRVARLLQDGVEPNKILVCTFTRTAATDLKKSLTALGTAGAEDVSAYTIHSFSFSLLSRAAVMEITGRVPRPLLKFEERFMLEDLKNDQFGGIKDCGKRLKAFDSAWARLQTDDPGWPQDYVDLAFQRELISWLRFHNAILIGELVPEALDFIRNNPESPIIPMFEHVLVDEYQDLNRADQVLIDEIAHSSTLTVIGDENQSIYAFRFASPEVLTMFNQTHAGTHDEKLIDCRRCPKKIVEIANALISNNTNRANRPITPFPDNPNGEIYLFQWSSMYSEGEGLAEYIKRRVSAGDVEPGNILVLSPRRQFGYKIRNALNNLGVLAHSFFHEEELDAQEAQDAFALLELLAYPDDRVSLRCWCGFGSNSYNKSGWSRIREHCEISGDSPIMVLEKLTSGSIQIAYTGSIVERYRLLHSRLNYLNGLKGQSLVDALFPVDQNWTKSLRTLSATLGGDDFEPPNLLEHLRINITQPELPTDVNYVRVMSLHKSKGLTADMVVIVGCIDGLIPTLQDKIPLDEQNQVVEEQRRLFYVALTRSRKILVLSSFTTMARDLAFKLRAMVVKGVRTHAGTIASRFLKELGPSCPRAVSGRSFLREK